MKATPPPLQIAKPCPKSWKGMAGDSKKRFCEHCQLHVHNLSEMSGQERKDFVSASGGRLCIAYVRRTDGSMVTPSLWGTLRRQFDRARWGVAAGLAALLPFAFTGCATKDAAGNNAACDPHLQKTARKTPEGEMTLGMPMPVPEPEKKKPR